MIILDAATKSLKAVLGGTVSSNQCAITTHYTDITTTAYTPGSTDTVTNNTTAVEIVASPAVSTQRHVQSISVYNADTAAVTVTVQYVSAGGTRQLTKVALPSLYALYYESGMGWQVVDDGGNTVTTYSGGYTGTGALVRATSPTLTAPNLGTPSAVVLTNASGTVTNLTLVTPALGTPASGTLTNCTGLPLTGLASQPVLTNLLTNSQWIAMSGSTLEEADATAVSVTGITAGVCACTATRSLAIGKLIRFDAGGTTANKVYEITALTANTSFTLHDTSITDATAVTGHEVTPGYVAADTLAPDTSTKTTTLDLHQYWNCASANTYGYGKYLMKATKGADGAEYWNLGTALDYRQCQGQPVAMGCFVYSVTETDNVKLSIHDGVSEIALSATYCGANAITWMEVTGTVAANASALTPRVLFDGSTGDVAYISPIMFVRGTSIGAGNYQPIPNEVIWLQNYIQSNALHNKTGLSTTSSTLLNTEVDTNGAVGKGVKALTLRVAINDSSASPATGAFFLDSSTNTDSNSPLALYSMPNDALVSQEVIIKTDANGDLHYEIGASGSGTFDVYRFMYYAIQT